MIYLEMLILAAVVVYIVDLSGFTQSWRTALAHALKRDEIYLRPLPPFDCSQCMTFWACLAYSAITGHFGLFTFAFSGLLALLSVAIGAGELFIREWATQLFNKHFPKV